eukprot:jgi/Botrbrau1/8220/Bobra.0392s0016.1
MTAKLLRRIVSSALPRSIHVLVLSLSLPGGLMAVRDAATGKQPRVPVLSPIPVTPFNAPGAGASLFASHAAMPTPLSTEHSLEDLVGEPGRMTGRPQEPPKVAMTASDSVPNTAEPPIPYPHTTASRVQQLISHESAAKTANCSGNSEIIRPYGDPTICRVFMFRNRAGTKFDVYTGWFADKTHVVTTGAAVATGGAKVYNVVAVGGRYGVVCCTITTAANGPASCPEANAYNIIRVVTSTGWINKDQLTNAGAVMKVNRNTPHDTANYEIQNPPACPNEKPTHYVGYPYPSDTSAGCSTANEDTQIAVDGLSPLTCNYLLPALPTFTTPGMSSCPGVLGGPYYFDQARITGTVVSSDATCTDGRSSIGAAGISPGNTSWGFALASLIKAVP